MRFLCFAIAALLASGLAARADVLYTYSGQNYSIVEGAYTTNQSVTGEFTLAVPLAATLQDKIVQPTSFSFNDGLQTITETSAGFLDYFFFSTDASGGISYYSFILNGGYDRIIVYPQGSQVGLDEASFAYSNVGGSLTGPLPVVTPEPSSIALLGTGLFGVIGILRKRFVEI